MALRDQFKKPQRVTLIAPDGLALEVDVSLNETHAQAYEVTDQPVERGADLSDHRREKPAELQLRGLFTDTPSGGGDFSAAAQGLSDAVASEFEPGQGERSKEAFRLLHDLQALDEPIEVVTNLRLYRNMTILSLSAPIDASTGRAVFFDATLREIFFAESQTRAAVVIDEPTQTSPTKTTQQGKKGGIEAPPEPIDERSPFLRWVVNPIAAFFGG